MILPGPLALVLISAFAGAVLAITGQSFIFNTGLPIEAAAAFLGATVAVVGTYIVVIFEFNAKRKQREAAVKANLMHDIDALYKSINAWFIALANNRNEILDDAVTNTVWRKLDTVKAPDPDLLRRLADGVEVFDTVGRKAIVNLLQNIQVFRARYEGLKPSRSGEPGGWTPHNLRHNLLLLGNAYAQCGCLLEWARDRSETPALPAPKIDDPIDSDIINTVFTMSRLVERGLDVWPEVELDEILNPKGKDGTLIYNRRGYYRD